MAPGQTSLPLDRYIAGREHARLMPRVSVPALSGRAEAWTSLGPGNIGGRTRSLVLNPQNPNILYAGAVSGGVWKTTDGGASWTQLTATSPDHSSLFGFVNRLVMSPNSRNRIYAATDSGVMTSGDGGNTWMQLGSRNTQLSYGCDDLVIRTDQSTDYLFASCSGPAGYAIFRNTDASQNAWAQVFTAPYMNRTSLALAPSQQSTIYAMATSYGGDPHYQWGLLGVYRSISNGDAGSWTTQVSNSDANITNTLLLTSASAVTYSYCNGGALTYAQGQGDWDNALAVDPLDPDRVWAGGVDVFRSDDGGVTWGAASLWQLSYSSPQFAHADRHLFVFHPGYDGAGNQTMYLATDGGVFRTDNARAAVSTGPRGACQSVFSAAAAIRWANLNHSYVATQYYHGAAYPGGLAYMGGAQDTSVTRGNDATGVNHFLIFTTGDGGAVAVDPADANRYFASLENLSLNRSANGLNGVTATSGITESSASFPFIAFLAMDPNEGKRLFLGGSTTLWRTVDGAVNWTAAAPTASQGSVSAIAVSPADSNTVLFGTSWGYISRSSSALSSNGSTKWPSVQPRFGSVSSIAFDPTNPNIVYAVYSTINYAAGQAHVYRSVDGGVTWNPSDGAGNATLPDIPAFRLIVNPYNNRELFLGTDLGVYVSEDGGNTWAQDTSLENVIVEELGLDNGANSNWLFAFTHGRGMYRTPLPGAPNPDCTYSVSPTSISADAFGSIVPVAVTAPPGCHWTALPGTLGTQFYIQSPAQGTGSGTALVVVEANNLTSPASDQLVIANTPVSITQSATQIVSLSSSLSGSPTVLSVPGVAVTDSRTLIATGNNPVQSCSGSAGAKNAWWSVTAPSSGYLEARALGRRYDSFGNSGIVLTAYPQGALGNELACALAARDSNYPIDAVIQFPVTAGSQYLIEIAATGSATANGGYLVLSVTSGAQPPASVTVTPGTATVTAGSGQVQQFSAQVANALNGAVRWSLTPAVGTISPGGLYTPPQTVATPTTITVTATSFADATKQSSAVLSLVPGAAGLPVVSLVATTNEQSLAVAPNSWMEIKGINLAPDTRIWQAGDFVNQQLPVQLDGVSVKVDGKPAFVYYISPTQVNVLTPLDAKSGPVQVQLATSAGSAPPMTIHLEAESPEFFVFGGGPYVAATHADGSYLGPTSLIPGYTTPAAAGETVVVYGNGFGQTVPPVVNGATTQVGSLPALPVVTIGGIDAVVSFAGVISPGLYQFNVKVPGNLAKGDHLLVATYNGIPTQANLLLTVK